MPATGATMVGRGLGPRRLHWRATRNRRACESAPPAGRTQQRIELLEKTANFQRGSEVRWCAALDNPRGVLSIHISSWALSGASLEIRIWECAALIVFGGRHSQHGWERRPHSFLWNSSVGKERNEVYGCGVIAYRWFAQGVVEDY